MFRRPRRASSSDRASAISRSIDVGRALSNLFAILFFGGALSIVAMTFGRGGV